jgi:hypothetical protein
MISSRYEREVPFLMIGKVKTGDLGGGKAVKRRMSANKVEKEHEHRYEIVSGIERSKALFGFIPSLELLVETFDEIV